MTFYYTVFLMIVAFFLQIPMNFGQEGLIRGTVTSHEGLVNYASIVLDGKRIFFTDENGEFEIKSVSNGHHEIEISYLTFQTIRKGVEITNDNGQIELQVMLEPALMLFDEVVITGTKTFKRKTKSAVIVNVIDSKTLANVQACNLSEGLKFQPGLRVETDCQTCNYTQLRMNGLAGGYSQILINGRPIFSPLTGLYGLEQIPVNMIDRIEVIRGGGSSLYGSSAIGGTVNVLTKIPKENQSSIDMSYQNINGQSNDFMINGNTTILNKSKNIGVSLFLNKRDREAYDHNGDNFSEIPQITNTSVGLSSFILPSDNQKIEFSLSRLHEYRYGGEMVDKPAHLALQSEERTHNVWMASADYQINFNQNRSSLISYLAWQNTTRDHYTGIIPDDEIGLANHLSNPPYGISLTRTFQGGIQLNHSIDKFIGGSNVLTAGVEYVVDNTFDEIQAYHYLIDQETKDVGAFIQSDWEILPSLNLLSGVRIDFHNLVDRAIASPRFSLLYKYSPQLQIRAGFGSGFRAPQAFDTDLHIAFAGGGVSRVSLSPDLKEETSKSYNASINYDYPTEHWVAGFTIEGFHTQLYDAFTLKPIGEDAFGELFEKQNDQGAEVKGTTLELRANYDRKMQIETGFTLQSSKFDNAIQYINEIEPIRDFIRTPQFYGFASFTFTPNERLNANLNYVYTGSMIVPHFAGAPNQVSDELFMSPSFSDISLKLGYSFDFFKDSKIEIYGGVKNIFNSYQSAFDIGKNRDSNFVYGPSNPRILYAGLKWTL